MIYSDYTTFVDKIQQLAATFGRNAREELIKGYWDSLKRHDARVVFQAIDQARDESTKWPSPAVIHGYIGGVRAHGQLYEQEPYDVGPKEREAIGQALGELAKCFDQDRQGDWHSIGGPKAIAAVKNFIAFRQPELLREIREARAEDEGQAVMQYPGGDPVPERPPF